MRYVTTTIRDRRCCSGAVVRCGLHRIGSASNGRCAGLRLGKKRYIGTATV